MITSENREKFAMLIKDWAQSIDYLGEWCMFVNGKIWDEPNRCWWWNPPAREVCADFGEDDIGLSYSTFSVLYDVMDEDIWPGARKELDGIIDRCQLVMKRIDGNHCVFRERSDEK